MQWALYYPPVLYAKAGAPAAAETAAQRAAGQARRRQRGGRGQGPRRGPEGEPQRRRRPRPADDRRAWRRNRQDDALATAQKAVAAEPEVGHARRSRCPTPGRRSSTWKGRAQSLETAVELEPDDALAWARLAEIRSSLGEGGASLEAARKAAELEPNLARTQTVLGFSYLTQVQTGEATAAFAKAIELDPATRFPRLGLGLAQIRDGHLAEGSREIEIAVSLDPGQSLVRSYLGKAYFEEKRDAPRRARVRRREAGGPEGPDALALRRDRQADHATGRSRRSRDFQKAIELNDNRAVYRSRLLLDSDLAARSASLGRIYTDLGFQDLALVEGWNSVNTDPSNYSAHRLLADSYAALPRHEIARVSELFQSQMLQPLNTTPIQPSLGESNLFLISSQGPGALAFNEFNPLFNRNQVNAQGSFLVGEDDTLAGEGIVSGIYKKLSFSAGYSGFKTDGFRENNSQDDKIANAFVQVELSPSTSLQAEVPHRDLDDGRPRACASTRTTSACSRPRRRTAPTCASACARSSAPPSPCSRPTCTRTRTSTSPCPSPDLAQSFALGREREGRQRRGAAAVPLPEGQGRGRRRLLRHRLRRDDHLRDRRSRLRLHRHHDRRLEDQAHQPLRLRLPHARQEPDR